MEILLDLHAREQVASMHCVMRGFALHQKDPSPFTEHVFLPEVTEWFRDLPESSRAAVNEELGDAVFARADKDALDRLYRAHYEDRLDRVERLHLHPYAETVALDHGEQGFRLALADRHTGARRSLQVDAVVLATGFRQLAPGVDDDRTPPLLEGIADRLERQASGCVAIAPDYRIRVHTDTGATLPVYLNGLAISSHGLGDAGSFPLLTHRADCIARSLGAANTPRDRRSGECWQPLAERRQPRPLRATA